VFADGSAYDGAWAEGVYHGAGTLVQPNGRTFVGEFRKGERHGNGTETDAAGVVIYRGEWIDGVRADQVGLLLASQTEKEQDQQAATPKSPKPSAKTATTTATTPNQKVSAATVVTPDTTVAAVEEDETCHAVVNQPVADVHGNEGKYTGIVSKVTNKPHGTGRLVYADGRRIHEGFWTQGSKEGFGRCLFFPQGDFHEGEYKNNLRHGPGRYQWKDGRSFVGGYLDDLRHGKGVFTYPSGERYDGDFSKGQRHGLGRFEFEDGKGFYKGEWFSGAYHGKGRLVWSNGSVYEGEFCKGAIHGKGVQRSPSGENILQGEWIEGKFQEVQDTLSVSPLEKDERTDLQQTELEDGSVESQSSDSPNGAAMVGQ